jgi:hypothetical protein
MGMILIATDYMQKYFPLWSQYCEDPDTKEPSVTILEEQRDRAQNIMLGFIQVDETTMTDPLREQLFSVIKYLCFGLKQGDTEFSTDPQIVKDYKDVYKLWLSYKKGEIPVDAVSKSGINRVTIRSKPRLFNKWFNPKPTYLDNNEGLD